MRHLLRWSALVVLSLLLVGCESSIEPPPEPSTASLSDQARTAMTLLPRDGRMVAMVDLQQMRTHGPAALREAFAEVSNPSMAESEELQEFLAESGLDLSTDIERVYLTQPRAEDARPYLVLTGSFDHKRIGQALEAQAGRDVQQTEVAGMPAFTLATDGAPHVALAVVRSTLLVVAPSLQDLEPMLSRSASGSPATDDMLLQAASSGQSAWYVLRDLDAPRSSDAPDDMEQLGRALQDMAGSFTFTDDGALDGTLTLVPKPGASPSDVADVVRGLVAAAKQSSEIGDDARQALERTEVRATNGTVTITAHLPASLVDRMAQHGKHGDK